MKALINWLRTMRDLPRTVAGLQQELRALQHRECELRNFVDSCFEKHVDVHPAHHEPSTVILIGRLRGQDYVQSFNVYAESLPELVEHLRHCRGRLGRVDAAPEFRAMIKREVERF